jgi:hypothetical protein
MAGSGLAMTTGLAVLPALHVQKTPRRRNARAVMIAKIATGEIEET